MKIRSYILALSILFLSITTVSAYNNNYEDFDTSLTQGVEYSYQEPEKLLLIQITNNYENLSLNLNEFIDSIYYYSITRLKLGNIPYHYILDESGNVYKTQNYDSINIADSNYLVIGYLSNNGQLTGNSQVSLSELVKDLSYKYGLKGYDVSSYSIRKTDNTFSELELKDPNDLFKNSIDDVLKDWEGDSREHFNYSASIESLENEESVTIGSKLKVSVTIKNENDFVWTSNRFPIYISVKDSEDSIFAENEVWDSFNKPTHIASDIYVLPGETVTVEFNIDPKVKPGEYSETFTVLKFKDEPFTGSEFTVNFNVEKGDQRIVQIDSPEAGYVNIRTCRRFSCDQVDVVYDGEVYPIVEYDESCWYKIRYSEGKEGWFYCPYGNEIE
jgi:hypothetical protein